MRGPLRTVWPILLVVFPLPLPLQALLPASAAGNASRPVPTAALPHASSQGATCADPALAALTPPEVPSEEPPILPYEKINPAGSRLYLGIGRLHPTGGGGWDWYRQARIPLFAAPGEEPLLWILDGWLLVGRRPSGTFSTVQPLETAGMVETEYEVPSFIVLESRNDGWIRLRWAPDSAGVAWTHSCLLSLGRQPLVVQTWAELFESFEDSPMYFRSEVRHSLRTGASIDSARIGWVPASPNDYHLEPLEIRGDWMRVEPWSLPTTAPAPMRQHQPGAKAG